LEDGHDIILALEVNKHMNCMKNEPPYNHWQNAILASLPECASWCRYFHNKDKMINIFLTFPAGSLEIIPFILNLNSMDMVPSKSRFKQLFLF
jgi:hypothetical protein